MPALSTEYASLLNRPSDMAAVEALRREIGSTSGSEFYSLDTPAGQRRYPRVTTVLDGISQPWLARWVARLEQDTFRTAAIEALTLLATDGQPIPRAAALDAMSRLRPELESERVKQTAAAFGSRMHSAIERYLRTGTMPDTTDIQDPALSNALHHWLDWWHESGLTAHRIEQRVGCYRCGYGGTMDLTAYDRAGLIWVIDHKSSKRMSANMGLQLSAYGHASPDQITGGGMIVRVPRGPRARVETKTYSVADLAEHFAVFKCALALYRWGRAAQGEDAGDDPFGTHALPETTPTATTYAEVSL